MEVLFNLFAKNSLGICMVDAGGNCVNMNDTFCEILDIQRENLSVLHSIAFFPMAILAKTESVFFIIQRCFQAPDRCDQKARRHIGICNHECRHHSIRK